MALWRYASPGEVRFMALWRYGTARTSALWRYDPPQPEAITPPGAKLPDLLASWAELRSMAVRVDARTQLTIPYRTEG